MADRPKLNDISLGKLKGIDNTKTANIIVLPLPTGDSDETETFDMLGVVRTITLSGSFVGSRDDIVADIESFEALVDGEQETSYELDVDEISADTLYVKIESIRTNWDLSQHPSNKCDYTIKLVQGTNI
jgi:hypothetical protein